MVRKWCLKEFSVSPTYDFKVRSAFLLQSQLPGNVAGVYGLLDIWHAGVDDALLSLFECFMKWVFFF